MQPNIVLILADDLGFSDIGCFGSEIHTPNLDKLGNNGLRLTQFYNSSRCCPSRASLLTGLSPHQAGVGHMVDDWGVGPEYQGWLREDAETIGEVLQKASYHTCYSGKWHVNWSFEPAPGEPVDIHHHKLGSKGYPHPKQRGFNDVYALMAGATSLFNPQHLLDQDEWINAEQPGYYITDAITDQAISMINNRPTDLPFFLHLSHIAPHWPLHALPDDIEKYKDFYNLGWDEIRFRRHEKLKQLGLIEKHWECSPRDEYAPEWSSLSVKRQHWEASRMATYAAMIDRLDQSIGRLLICLDENKITDNTIILFLSDNGGCAEFLNEDGWCKWYNHRTWDGLDMRLGEDESITPGAADTFMSYGLPWANASNTPFRLFKHFVHEGGIASPAIFSWPEKIKQSRILHEPCHVQDILPTFIEFANFKTHDSSIYQHPSGESFADLINNPDWKRSSPICFEHEGNSAIRKGPWKAVRKHPDEWELYDMRMDRTELHDLATAHPDVLKQLIDEYEMWCLDTGVRPWPPGKWPEWMTNDEFRKG